MNAKILPLLAHDGALTIATGASRQTKLWKNTELRWSELLARFAETTRTGETVAAYRKLPKAQQDSIKDVGGFVGGSLKGGRRKADAVAWRQLLTLDADFAPPDLWERLTIFFDHAGCCYSTHKHTPQKPRLRLAFPLARPVTPDEYQAIARRIAADLDAAWFDDTTYEPSRLMYWPSTSSDGEYIFEHQDGPWMDPDEVLARYPDWRDPRCWPESERAQALRRKECVKQGDPLTKEGMVGAFCRAYSIEAAIEAHLSDVYAPCEGFSDRYTYLEGSTVGGLVLYEQGRFAYSHYATDPAGGKLCNAFDLVRIHLFGAMDEDEDVAPGTPGASMPSYQRMLDFAGTDETVRRQLGADNLRRAQEEFGEADKDWVTALERDRKGVVKSTINNARIILEHDQHLAGKLWLDEMAHRLVVRGELPWRKHGQNEPWNNPDNAGLRHYLETVFDLSGREKIKDALEVVAMKNAFHPVVEYLDGLAWDGEHRLERLFIDTLGAQDTPYIRAVTRKSFVAAVARVRVPGIKYDTCPVLIGPQGIGKSLLLYRMGGAWFLDSLGSVDGKEAYELLQGRWIVELAELAATRRADIETIKHFLSKQEDVYRVPYAETASTFPRQCVFFGTTNQTDFLRDPTGGRRFWPVQCAIQPAIVKPWTYLTPETVGQLWAEADALWKAGESLYLGAELADEARALQEAHTEESPKVGVIREYLETLLPAGWAGMDLGARREFLHADDELAGAKEGTIPRDKVCVMEIWAELFMGELKQLTRLQATELHEILAGMPGWKRYTEGSGKLYFGGDYGHQRAYVKTESCIRDR